MFFVKPSWIFRYIFPKIIWKKETPSKEIWLTFDDGPEPEVTSWILSTLNELQVKATFFLIGKNIVKFPELIKSIKRNKHVVGNHSFSHKNGWLTKHDTYIKDIKRCQQLMKDNNLFRPPYGKISLRQQNSINKQYKIILWDILSMDFKENITKEKIIDNVLENVEPGSIIVFHNNLKSFANLKLTLKEIILELKKNGFVFSTTW